MIIKTFVSGPFETNSYIVYDKDSGKAIIIDAPPEFCEPAIDFITENKLIVEKIILTHGHIDHIADAGSLRRLTQARIFMHEDDYFWLNPPEYMLAWISGKFERFNPDEAVHEGDEILLGGISFKAIHTPGHSRGGICLYCKENNVIFSGDTIFQESIGRTDLTGGSKNTLLKSISEKILILPDETEIYPGHGDKTKLINEKKYNPFLQKIGVNDEISD